jgi:hypothetical protein
MGFKTKKKTDTVRTSQEIRYVSATETNRLMLFRETVAVYCEDHIEHMNTECGHTVKLMFIKAAGIYLREYFKR